MKKKTKIYQLVVIGGGVAGVAAVVHAKTIFSDTLLIEKGIIGGKINEIFMVNNYSGFSQIKGKELGLIMKKQILESGILVRRLEVIAIEKEGSLFVIKGQNNSFYSYALIIATGSNQRELRLEGIKNIHYKNFSYKVVDDGHLAKNKKVLIVGGGYSGCQTADFLSGFAEKVYLIHRQKELTVDVQLKNRIIANDKIEIYLNSILLKTSGKRELESCTILIDGAFQKELKVKMIFPCIGTTPNSSFVKQVVDCTEMGYIRIDTNFQTSTEGLFAVGDVTLKDNLNSQIAIALAEGTQVAQSAAKYLLERSSREVH